jgi:hypothetical protein
MGVRVLLYVTAVALFRIIPVLPMCADGEPSGHYMDGSDCKICTRGYSCPDDSTSRTKCDAGRFQPAPGQFECLACEMNSYSPTTTGDIGVENCTQCSAGYQNLESGSTECSTNCTSEYYRNAGECIAMTVCNMSRYSQSRPEFRA